jgi:phosphate transport system substrate-binding protein
MLNRALGAAVLMLSALGAASAETLRLGGSNAAQSVIRYLATVYQERHGDVQFQYVTDLSSSGGIQATRAGAIDIGFSSQELTDAQKQGLTVLPLGRTPWVIAVPLASPLRAVTTQQLEAIYSLRQNSWPNGAPIRLVVAPAGDRDNNLLAKLSPAMAAAIAALPFQQLIVGQTDAELLESIERIPNTIGASTLAVMLAGHRRVKPLPLNGIEPSPHNLAAGIYPYSKTYRLLMRNPPTKAVLQFVDFIRSSEGQKLLEQYGVVPVK